MKGLCPLCGRDGPLEGHHPTGRIQGRPIHRRFIFWVCGPCNRAQNSLWRLAGIDADDPTVEVLLRRLATWFEIWDRTLDIHQYLALCEVLADLADRATEAA